MIVVMALFFAALTPGVFVCLTLGLPQKFAPLVHGLIFAIVWHFLHRPISQLVSSIEGFADAKAATNKKPASK